MSAEELNAQQAIQVCRGMPQEQPDAPRDVVGMITDQDEMSAFLEWLMSPEASEISRKLQKQNSVEIEKSRVQGKGRGFASMSPQRQREIASMGGKAAQATGRAHKFTSEEARAAGRKGGHVSRRRSKYA